MHRSNKIMSAVTVGTLTDLRLPCAAGQLVSADMTAFGGQAAAGRAFISLRAYGHYRK